MTIRTEITTDSKKTIKLYTAIFSTGDALETDTRFGHDASGSSRTIVRRRRNTALGGTIRLAASAAECANNGMSIFDYIRDVQRLVGRLFTLTWYGREYPKLLCKSVQIQPECDCVETFSGVSMSITFVQGYTPKRTAQTAVRAL